MSAISPVYYDKPIDWVSIVGTTLNAVHHAPAPSVMAALTTLNSYSNADASLFADAANGMRDTKVYASLLNALDRVIEEWPLSLQSRVRAPAVRHGDFVISAHRPRVEAVLGLYNAAVANIEEGIVASQRVRADVAKKEHLTTTTAGSTNAKTSYKYFVNALQLATAAEEALSVGEHMSLSSRLTASERSEVHACLDVRGLRRYAEVCAAVSKYTFSLFSSAVASKPDVLAKLAFTASALPVPESQGDKSLTYLSRLMLVAYHRHKAESYYRADPKVPDISNALAHIDYADALLRQIEAECARDHGEEASSSSATKGWASRLWDRLRPSSPSQQDSTDDAEALEEADNAQASSAYARITRLLNGTDLSDVFPLITTLLNQVYEMRKRYRYENRVVYFAKVVPLDVIRLDVPEVELVGATTTTAGARIADQLASAVDESAFRDMPSADVLAILVAKQAAHGATRATLKARTELLRESIAKLEEMKPPHEVELAMEALTPCLEDHTGSVQAALDVAKTALSDGWQHHVSVVQQWALTKEAHTGMVVPVPAVTAELEKDVDRWMRREAAAATAWVREVGPLDFGNDMDALRMLLMPQSLEVTEFIQSAKLTADKVSRLSDSAKADDVNAALQRVEALQEESEQWLSRQQAVCHPSRWAMKKEAMREVALIIWDSPELLAKLNAASESLEKERAMVVTRPHNTIQSERVEFRSAKKTSTTKTNNNNSNRKKRARSPSPAEDDSSVSSAASSQLGTPQEEMEDELPVPTKIGASLLSAIRANRKAPAPSAAKKKMVPPSPPLKSASKSKPAKKTARKK